MIDANKCPVKVSYRAIQSIFWIKISSQWTRSTSDVFSARCCHSWDSNGFCRDRNPWGREHSNIRDLHSTPGKCTISKSYCHSLDLQLWVLSFCSRDRLLWWGSHSFEPLITKQLHWHLNVGGLHGEGDRSRTIDVNGLKGRLYELSRLALIVQHLGLRVWLLFLVDLRSVGKVGTGCYRLTNRHSSGVTRYFSSRLILKLLVIPLLHRVVGF